MGPRAGLDGRKISPPTGIRSPDRPARSLSLYQATPPTLYNEHRDFIPVERPKPRVDHLPHPTLRLRKEYSNTCCVEMADSCSFRGQALLIAREQPVLKLSHVRRLPARRPAGNVLTLVSVILQ